MISFKTYLKNLLMVLRNFKIFTLDLLKITLLIPINLIKYKKIQENNLVFVTASDSNFFNKSLDLLSSLEENTDNQIIFYDLGLNKQQLSVVKKQFPDISVFQFNFEKYPNFISKYTENKLGHYAWKPIIIEEVLDKTKKNVIWIDAGSTVGKRILFLKISFLANSILTVNSSNKISDWTHVKTLSKLDPNNKHLRKRNCAGGLVGFKYDNPTSRKVINLWSKFSQIEEIISPIGSDRSNHRQDQAILSILLHEHYLTSKILKNFKVNSNFSLGVYFHDRKLTTI